MSILYAVLCGAIQGACEFLPVSSSGHLALFHELFGGGFGGGEMGFDVLLHLGTLCAVVIAYRRDVMSVARAFFSASAKIVRGRFILGEAAPDEKTALMLTVATVPLAAAVLIKDKVETLSAYPEFVGAMLALNGAMLIFGGIVEKKIKRRASLGVPGALGIGAFQLMACLPGLSRSGSTITGGCVFGLTREEAVRFSFLMSIPAIIGANAFSLPETVREGVGIGILPCLFGFLTAGAVGYLAIRLIRLAARKKNFNIFGIYCIILGLFMLIR